MAVFGSPISGLGVYIDPFIYDVQDFSSFFGHAIENLAVFCFLVYEERLQLNTTVLGSVLSTQPSFTWK
jgi:hypothetical protein